MNKFVALLFCVLVAFTAQAQEPSSIEALESELSNFERCILFSTLNAPNTKTAAEIKSECHALVSVENTEVYLQRLDWRSIDWENTDFPRTSRYQSAY